MKTTPWWRGPRAAELGLALVACLVATLGAAALLWPMPTDPGGLRLEGFFADSHVWCFQYMDALARGEVGWQTGEIGWPFRAELRFIGWLPAVVAMPFQALLGPIGAYNMAVWASFPLAALACHLLLRVLGAHPVSAVVAAQVYAFCPFALGSLVAGQVAKLQHGLFAAVLLAFVLSTRRWRWLPLAPLLAWVLAYTAPTLAMMVPLALLGVAVWAPMDAWQRAGDGRRARGVVMSLLRLGITVGAVAAVMLAARDHYDFQAGRDQLLAFAPNTRGNPDPAHLLGMVAEVDTWLRGPIADLRGRGGMAQSFRYLGLPLVVLGVALSLRRAPGTLLGLGWLVVGAVVALGPRLAGAEGFIELGGSHVALPAVLLEIYDYPLARSGMYHRVLVLAALGGAVVIGVGARRQWWLALLAAGWVVVDLAVAVGPFFPIPSAPVPGRQALELMATDPRPGAVLSLPVQVDDHGAGVHLMLASFHGRPTHALARDLQNVPPTQEALRVLGEALEAPDPALSLSEAGVAYVLFIEGLDARREEPGLRALEAALGPGQDEGGLIWWAVSTP